MSRLCKSILPRSCINIDWTSYDTLSIIYLLPHSTCFSKYELLYDLVQISQHLQSNQFIKPHFFIWPLILDVCIRRVCEIGCTFYSKCGCFGMGEWHCSTRWISYRQVSRTSCCIIVYLYISWIQFLIEPFIFTYQH